MERKSFLSNLFSRKKKMFKFYSLFAKEEYSKDIDLNKLRKIHQLGAIHTIIQNALQRGEWSVLIDGKRDEVYSKIFNYTASLACADFFVYGIARMTKNFLYISPFDEEKNFLYKKKNTQEELIELVHPDPIVKKAQGIIEKINYLENAQLSALKLAGASVIAYPSNMNLVATPDEVEKTRELIQRSLRNAGVGGVEIVPTMIEFTNISNINDYNFSELSIHFMRELASIYGIDSSLLNDPQNKTYNNKNEAFEQLYSSIVIPFSYTFIYFLKLAFLKEGKINISFDVSWDNLEVISKRDNEKVEKVLSLYDSGIIGLKKAREMLGIEDLPTE